MTRFLAAVALLCAVVACTSDKKENFVSQPADLNAITVTSDLAKKPEVTFGGGAAPAQLYTRDIVEGTGAAATAGKTVSVQYVGLAWSDKKQFDASWDRGQPFSFDLGAGRVIKGWDQGVLGMKVGGRRLLVIPPNLGYGAAGAGGVIKGNETLVFVVDLKKVS